ncbi:MAG: nicotinate-nucleotide--dimethylbenzimidazole phosphoribosyltransferase [Lachnospiraceae bacterium]|nr:nicotinate-nucleotide--dimethylbenzimidazole phosphoribosyltransferase [Lachnospiraceae bacterium]
MSYEKNLKEIRPSDQAAYEACRNKLNQIAKPLGSLGSLETLLEKIGAIAGSTKINLRKKGVLVFCADNGVIVHGVSQSDSSVTTAIAHNLAAGTASVCVMAKACGADVFPIDMGMKDTVAGLMDCKLMQGTKDMVTGPAMSRDTAIAAIETGIALVKEKKEQGYGILATGEAGIGNTTTSSAVAAVLLGRPVDQVCGRGAGLSSEGLVRKCEAIQNALKVNQPDACDPVDVLAKVGGLDIAGMVGAFLGGAIYGIPVVMDGVISATAALCAVRLHAHVKDYILPSHMSAEPAGQMLCDELGLEPIVHAGMHLGEGTGAVLLFPILDVALAVYEYAATFEEIAVEAYVAQK